MHPESSPKLTKLTRNVSSIHLRGVITSLFGHVISVAMAARHEPACSATNLDRNNWQPEIMLNKPSQLLMPIKQGPAVMAL